VASTESMKQQTSTTAMIGKPAPALEVAWWVQGGPANINTLKGRVVLVEVFQVNCPGCFVHALPEAVQLHERYEAQGLTVIGLATAFEDFDKNTLANLERLLQTGEMIGDPLRQLGQAGLLQEGKLEYTLPFAVGMDVLSKNEAVVDDATVDALIQTQLPDYDSWSDARKQPIYAKARAYLEAKTHRAHTFETYRLQGTPSSILIDREGILRDVSFGYTNHLEAIIIDLLHQPIR